jgi:hypothetical protein
MKSLISLPSTACLFLLELSVRWYTVVYILGVYIEVPTPRYLKNQAVSLHYAALALTILALSSPIFHNLRSFNSSSLSIRASWP